MPQPLPTFILLLAPAVTLEVFADIFFKLWANNNRSLLLAVGIILYALGTLAWAYSLKFEQLSKAITLFTVVNLVAVILVGVFFFKENLNATSTLGIILGIISVVLLSL